MADAQKLENWLAENAEALDLQATQLSWPQDWGLRNLFDVEITINVEGQRFVGRGTAIEEGLAFLKAGAEAIERAICDENSLSTIGVAVHTDGNLAEATATNELFEREAFFNHFHSRSPFSLVQQTAFAAVLDRWQPALERLSTYGIDLRLYRALLTNKNVAVCILEGLKAKSPFGGVIGLGSNDQAIESAFLEAIRTAAVVIETGAATKIAESNFLSLPIPTSFDRQKLARNEDYWAATKDDLFPTDVRDSQNPSRSGTDSEIKIETLRPKSEILKSAPIFCRRASFDTGDAIAQKDKSPATYSRLAQFLGHQIDRSQINPRPHFLG